MQANWNQNQAILVDKFVLLISIVGYCKELFV